MNFSSFCTYMSGNYGIAQETVIEMLFHDSVKKNPLTLLALYQYCRKEQVEVPESVLKYFDRVAAKMLEIQPAAKKNYDPEIKSALELDNAIAFRQFHDQWIKAFVHVRVKEERQKRKFGDRDYKIYELVADELEEMDGREYSLEFVKDAVRHSNQISMFMDLVGRAAKRRQQSISGEK